MALAKLRSLIRNNRSNFIVSATAAFCIKYLRAYYNEGYFDIERNGEKSIVAKTVGYFRKDGFFVLDIGANRGDWADAVLKLRPDAVISCFEIIPAVAEALKERFSGFSNVHVHNLGLSSKSHDVDFFWNKSADDTSSIAPRHADALFSGAEVEKIRCHVETGDAAVSRFGIRRIDLMKIDVEGHEAEVLSGFAKALSEKNLRPSVIQFEYGDTYIPSRHNLKEIYEFLVPCGYTIGRIYPEGVEFKEYAFSDDHFRMGNYVAVQAGSELEALLRKF